MMVRSSYREHTMHSLVEATLAHQIKTHKDKNVAFWPFPRRPTRGTDNVLLEQLQMADVVWAIKKNRPLFYGVPFEVYSDHQPLRNLFSSAEKVPRVQQWQDGLSAYTLKIIYKPGKTNSNADMMTRLLQDYNEADINAEFQSTNTD